MEIDFISFTICSMPKQNILNFDEAYIELKENYFRYVARYDSEEAGEDEGMPWEVCKVDLDIYSTKSAVKSVEKAYINKHKKWQLYISVSGKREDIWIYFDVKEECEEMFDKLINYFYGPKN